MLVSPNKKIGSGLCLFADSVLGHINEPDPWRKICHEDPDGDGVTNGEELGDPCCEWTPGAQPYRKWNLSHPGRPEENSTQAHLKQYLSF